MKLLVAPLVGSLWGPLRVLRHPAIIARFVQRKWWRNQVSHSPERQRIKCCHLCDGASLQDIDMMGQHRTCDETTGNQCSKSIRYVLNIFTIVVLIFLVLQYGIGLVLTRDYHQASWLNNASLRHDVEKSIDDVVHRWKLVELQKNVTIRCPSVPPKLVGRLYINKTSPSWDELEKKQTDLQPGGRFSPRNCVALYRVAVIVPYRDRDAHLRVFLNHMHPILQRQQLDYGIFIIEQVAGTKFNRAMLMNIGFAEASRLYGYQCYIFHDVDLLPEDDRNIYSCPDQPRHMSAAVDTMNYRLPYPEIYGGVSALKKEHFERVNGFSNKFFGWGGEDDDMWVRITKSGLHVIRYPLDIARYTMLGHTKDSPNPERYKYLYSAEKRFKTDGINSLLYKRLDLQFRKTYTWVYISFSKEDVLANNTPHPLTTTPATRTTTTLKATTRSTRTAQSPQSVNKSSLITALTDQRSTSHRTLTITKPSNVP
ncbi:Beta-1,4-N-acetylgalactosaminyltransferase bre-4 [Lamellibrachia satsuma]|nr:Beta-1,4-N-acetylgalactosaminyltransferase bre-4 [Lamellibrachia satsuma]